MTENMSIMTENMSIMTENMSTNSGEYVH